MFCSVNRLLAEALENTRASALTRAIVKPTMSSSDRYMVSFRIACCVVRNPNSVPMREREHRYADRNGSLAVG
jgi:hypothetical protein